MKLSVCVGEKLLKSKKKDVGGSVHKVRGPINTPTPSLYVFLPRDKYQQKFQKYKKILKESQKFPKKIPKSSN